MASTSTSPQAKRPSKEQAPTGSKKFEVGQEVLVNTPNDRGTPETGTVTTVGRTIVTVTWGSRGNQVTPFRIEDGLENTKRARDYTQRALRLFTLEAWAESQRRSELAARIRQHAAHTPYGGLPRGITTSDMERLADLLDEIQVNAAAAR